MIKLTNVSKSYNSSSNVLRDINLRVDDGEFVSIMGKSGSGKSTLINIIGFLDTKFSGQYYFNDTAIHSLPDSEFPNMRNDKVGFVFQNFKLIPTLSIKENVGLPLLYAGMKRKDIDNIITSYLEKVGLHGVEDKLPSTLSGGQQQRVAIARSIVSHPDFLIADEPTGALDSQTSNDIMTIFSDLNRAGTTIIMVTHDQQVAERGNRIIHIKDGQLEEDSCK
ncbi:MULTISPECIES: ABC transporter ATP-binding protein [Bacillota]|jgi:putative ABC transport system ATP-binding protein|uniref:ABC transporter ATP-binding protein n=1 Tax=Bacillota TaxID=1239 RepID=UPI00107FAAB0|nr:MULTISPECIES: ABC transporter ATP-binding protein [Bacillota]TGE63263.1 peptide ABC transporter ATP-binding protein [Weissella confusa]